MKWGLLASLGIWKLVLVKVLKFRNDRWLRSHFVQKMTVSF